MLNPGVDDGSGHAGGPLVGGVDWVDSGDWPSRLSSGESARRRVQNNPSALRSQERLEPRRESFRPGGPKDSFKITSPGGDDTEVDLIDRKCVEAEAVPGLDPPASVVAFTEHRQARLGTFDSEFPRAGTGDSGISRRGGESLQGLLKDGAIFGGMGPFDEQPNPQLFVGHLLGRAGKIAAWAGMPGFERI
jgi:hypothetical protein